MACEKYDELLQAFFDQSLGKSEQRDLKAHLDQCSDCRLDFILYKNVFETLDELPDEQAPDISGEILRVIEAEPYRPSSTIMRVVQPTVRHFGRQWALGLAACVLLAIGVFWGFSQPVAPLPQPLLTAAVDRSSDVDPADTVTQQVATARDVVKLVVDGSDVAVMRQGSTSWQALAGDTNLAFGDRIRTGAETNALLFFRDRGRLKVMPNTDMQVLARGVRIKQGRTWIKIFKRGTEFAAETPNAVAAVRGTVYTVEYDPEALSTRVNLFSSHNPTGGVEVGTETGKALLQEGTYVDVVIDELVEAAPIPLETYLAYNHLPPEQVVLGTDVSPQVDVSTVDASTVDVTTVDATTADVVDVPTTTDIPLPAASSAGRPTVDKLPIDKGEFFDSVKHR